MSEQPALYLRSVAIPSMQSAGAISQPHTRFILYWDNALTDLQQKTNLSNKT